MTRQRIAHIAIIMALPAALAACAAVDQVQQGMVRDWRSFEADVLKKPPDGKPVAARAPIQSDPPRRQQAMTAPQPPVARPAERPPGPAANMSPAAPQPAPAVVATAPAAVSPSSSQSDERLRLALALDYGPGKAAPDDEATAAVIRAGADGGDAQAACNLGMRYVNGRGVDRDWAEGESWLRRAAQHGYVPAQNNLGMLLASEQNPRADNDEALMWVSKAANAGYGPARAQLGMMYATGRGVTQDSRMADFWLASARQDMRAPAGSCEPLSAPQRAATR